MAILRDFLNVGIEEDTFGEVIEYESEHESNDLITINSMDILVAQNWTKQ